MTRYATIIGTGSYLPPIERPNAAMAEKFGEVIGKFEASSGIKTRFYAPDDWATSDLAVEAGKAALEEAGLKPEDLDLIILGTDSPDYITPATSVVVQYKLGAIKAGTFDVGCACASFPTGLNLAAGLIATNPQSEVRHGHRRLHDAQAGGLAERRDVLLLRRRRGRGHPDRQRQARLRHLHLLRRWLVPQALGHLLRRHLRTGHRRSRRRPAAPRCTWSRPSRPRSTMKAGLRACASWPQMATST